MQPNAFRSAHLQADYFRNAIRALPAGDPELDLLFGRYQGKQAPQIEPRRALQFSARTPQRTLGIADEVVVMYGGRIVERAPTSVLFKQMHMPYTEALLAAIPKIDAPPHMRLAAISGRPPDPTQPTRGCSFAPRCRYADARCRAEKPVLTPAGRADHVYACFHPLHHAAAGAVA